MLHELICAAFVLKIACIQSFCPCLVKSMIHAQKGSRTQTEEMPKACSDTEQSMWMSAAHAGFPVMPRNFLSCEYRSDILHSSTPMSPRKCMSFSQLGFSKSPSRRVNSTLKKNSGCWRETEARRVKGTIKLL